MDLPSGGWWYACLRLDGSPWQCSQCPCEQEIQSLVRVCPPCHWSIIYDPSQWMSRQWFSIVPRRDVRWSSGTCSSHMTILPIWLPFARFTCSRCQYLYCSWHVLLHQSHTSHLRPDEQRKVRSLLTRATTDPVRVDKWLFFHVAIHGQIKRGEPISLQALFGFEVSFS